MLTVHEDYYEENIDKALVSLLPTNLRIEKVKAFKRFLGIGDIGLRAFLQLYRKAKQIITKENIDFLYIPIPSFYCALLGRFLHSATGIKYGIDYIDPWVHQFPGSEKTFSKHWLSSKIAFILEPIAIKNAKLITGVAEGYYKSVLDRNPHLYKQSLFAAMPYGGEALDHLASNNSKKPTYLFANRKNKIQLVYAGAFLPKSAIPMEEIFIAIANNLSSFIDVEFHFIGTGKSLNDPKSFSIKPLAEKYDLWNTIIFEYPARIPYFDVISHLNQADAIFILGSTEPHYTPSKVYQAVLSEKPIFAVLHEKSSASSILKLANAGVLLTLNENNVLQLHKKFEGAFTAFRKFKNDFRIDQVNSVAFAEYSAKEVTRKLGNLLDQITHS